MKILITGGAGFIGSHVGGHLTSKGHHITVLDDFNDFYEPALKRSNIEQRLPDATVIEGDIRDKEAVAIAFSGGVDAVIHLAARAGVRPSIYDPELYISTNIQGTYNLLEASKVHGVKDFLFGSSSSVYGINEKTPFAEDDLIQSTISPYAMTKLAGEQLCSNFSKLYDMRCICLRFFTVYGPRQRPDLAIRKFTDLISQGKPVEMFGDGSTERDYTYIDDIVSGVVAALDYRERQFDIFNLGESETTKLRDLISHIGNAVGREPEILNLPDQPGDVPRTYADISKSRRLLGYNPTTKVEDGIPKFVEWYLNSSAVS